MKFISTRGSAPALSFEGALLAALASDGGLFMPEAWPRLQKDEIAALAGLDYADAAYRVMRPFLLGDPCLDDLEDVLSQAYEGFHHPAIAPLAQIGPNSFILELFHGPTLAFKDLAMQVVSRFMNRALRRRGQRATVVGATRWISCIPSASRAATSRWPSTSSFAPERACQRRPTAPDDHRHRGRIHNIAVEGTFDDCQRIVKALFGDRDLNTKLGLTGINSINFARILAQIPYYFTAAVTLGAYRPTAFTVPTGNFGDIFAGYAARAMGSFRFYLGIATNLNDSLLARPCLRGGTSRKA